MYCDLWMKCANYFSTVNEKGMNFEIFNVSLFSVFQHLDGKCLYSPIIKCPLVCVFINVGVGTSSLISVF